VYDAQAMPGFPAVRIVDTTDPEVDSASVDATYVPSSGYTTHQFEWWSQYPGGDLEVQVTAPSKAPQACKSVLGGGTQVLLSESTSGVATGSFPENGGWRHTLDWTTSCEAPCSYTYVVRNIVGGAVYATGNNSHVVSVCADITE